MADGNPLPVPTGAAKTPSDFLKSIKGKPVLVKLNSGVDYRGVAEAERGSALLTACQHPADFLSQQCCCPARLLSLQESWPALMAT